MIEALDESGARVVGQLLARSNTTDVVDASVVAGALRRGDAVVTSDQRDIETLASAVGRRVNIIAM